MTKRVHPIRKMQHAMTRYWLRVMQSGKGTDRAKELAKEQALISRHVKPLLDALELEHEGDMVGCRCSTCRLLAEWRAKP